MTEDQISTVSHDRLERAHRILDAAAELVLRWGYNKTTMDDVARHAGVGKGTLYLHWKTREDLFRMLLRREQVAMAEDFHRRIAADPDGARLGAILKHTMLVIMKRPLLKAMSLGDTDVWGKLLQGEYSKTAFIEKMIGFQAYLELLQQHKLVRSDLSIRSQVAMVVAMVMGFFISGPMLPDAYQHSDEELAELLSEAARNTFERSHPINPGQLQDATTSFLKYTEHIADLLEKQFQQEIES